MNQWDAPAVVLVITAIFSGISGLLSLLASFRAKRAEDVSKLTHVKVEETAGKVDTIESNTDGRLTKLAEQNQLLADKLAELTSHRVVELEAERDKLMAQVAVATADVIKRADAATPAPQGTARRSTDPTPPEGSR
jgi:glutamate-1-semialdehyde aminotransferase